MQTNRLLVAASAALLTLACSPDRPEPSAPEATPALAVAQAGTPNHLLVLKDNRSISGGLLEEIEAAGGRVVGRFDAVGLVTVEGLSVEGAAALGKRTDLAYVEPEGAFQLEQGAEVGQEALEAAGVGSVELPQTAILYPRQWWSRAVHADQAWAAGRLGSPAVTVAILDTGIDYLNPDLAGKVDLARSASFVPSDDALVAAFFPTRHPVTDLFYHGSLVATTVSSNAFAFAGVTSKVQLIGVKVCNVNGSCPSAGVLAGLVHAVVQGADVINLSLGSTNKIPKSDFPGFHAAINRIFNWARSQGATIVVSAGNSATDLDHDTNGYKTYCSTPATICVSATAPVAAAGTNGPWVDVDTPTSYTNFGRSAINVAAPGGEGATGLWMSAICSTSSLQFGGVCQTGLFVIQAAGTSFAAPMVAGLAALLVEEYGRNPARIKAALEQSADDLGQAGTDPYFGKGRINVARALGL